MRTKDARAILLASVVLILIGVLLLVSQYVELGWWVWVAVLGAGGLCALGLFLVDRSDQFMLLAAYILLAVAGLIAVATTGFLQDEAIALYVLFAIALPFLGVYLRNRAQWWWLIPAYALIAVGGVVILGELASVSDNLITTYVMFAIAIPFFFVYLRNRRQWWFLIPAGILSVIGLAFLVAENAFAIIGAVVLIGLGLWLLVRAFIRKEPPGDA
jgi:hypothetical protein